MIGNTTVNSHKKQLEQVLNEIVANLTDRETSIAPIIEYNLFPGGKRLRALLTLLMYKSLNGTKGNIYACAAVPELIHTATLMLDDLPSMDDSDYRRNKPSSHKAFGEADTILTAFGLAAESFRILSDQNNLKDIDDQSALNMIEAASEKIGVTGLIGGQIADLRQGKDLNSCKTDEERLAYITHTKTVVLFELCAIIASCLAEATSDDAKRLLSYARNVGMALQIFDDLQDSDDDVGLSFPKLYGVAGAKKLLQKHITAAQESIESKNKYAQLLQKLPNLLLKETA